MRDKPELKLRGDGLGFGGLNCLPQRLKQRKASGVVLLRLASHRMDESERSRQHVLGAAGRLVGLDDSGENLVGRVARVVWVARGRGPGLAALQRELADGMAAATRGATI